MIVYRPADSAEYRYHLQMHHRVTSHKLACFAAAVAIDTGYSWRHRLTQDARAGLVHALGSRQAGDMAAVDYRYALRCLFEPEAVIAERRALAAAEEALWNAAGGVVAD